MMPSSYDPCRSGGRPTERAVIFDLDDTLYLERDFVESGLAAVGVWAAAQLGIDRLGQEMTDCFRRGSRGRIFNEALLRAGLPDSPGLIARMIGVYRQHRPRISLAPDAERFLAGRSPDMAVGIITDGYLDAQRRKIRALGLHTRGVSFAVCTDRWGPSGWKPSTRAFEAVESFFGLHGASLTYVADNPNKDFHAPSHLGWNTVQISRPERLEQARRPEARRAERGLTSLDELEVD